ncbi:MAG: hypothetical protein ACLQVY_05200 [Limisphaerales bacterium]
MKLRTIAQTLSFAAGIAILPLSLAANQASSPTAPSDLSIAPYQSPSLDRVGWDEAKRKKLRHAYWILEQADHDYAGHRVKAMEEIRKAGRIMGMDLKGDGYGGERPHWSDALLREARRNLHDIVEESGGGEHKHIRLAIKEIDHALEAH